MASSLTPGAVLGGRYRLDVLLEDVEGARFWRATDTVLVRSVAVHALSESDPRVERVLEAARSSATVIDPHLLRVLDADVRDGIAWVINEWGSGQSLDVLVSRRSLAPDRAAWLAREVSSAITAAHAAGVAHGRLAPENVMVTEAGTVRLIGFAIDAELRGSRLRSGNYPDADPARADIIDLAGLLYTGLVARWPGASSSAVPPAPRESRGPLRPRRVRAGVPRPLDAICDRVLGRRSPSLSAHQLAAVLTEYLGEIATADPALLPDIDASLADLAGAMGQAPPRPMPRGAPSPIPLVVEPAGIDPAGIGPAGIDSAGPDPDDLERDEEVDEEVDPASGSAEAVDPPVSSPEPAEPEVLVDDVPWEQAEPAQLPSDPVPEVADPSDAADDVTGTDLAATGLASFEERSEYDADWHRPSSEPPPPAPALEPVPERPLFAPAGTQRTPKGPPPVSVTESWTAVHEGPPPDPPVAARTETGAEVSWPFGADPEDEPDDWEERTSRHWLRLPLLILLVAAVVVAATLYVTLGRGNGPSIAAQDPATTAPTTTPAPSGARLKIVAAKDFDPFGNMEENPQEVPAAVDGDKTTAWKTLTYRGRPTLGGLKPGVGLVVDLGSIQAVGSMTVDLVGRPTNLEVFAAPTSSRGPTAIDGLQRITQRTGAGGETELPLEQVVRTRYLVVWLTSLPPVPGGFRGAIAEITVRS